MKCATNRLTVYQNEMHLITVRVELKTICTVDVNAHAQLPWWCH